MTKALLICIVLIFAVFVLYMLFSDSHSRIKLVSLVPQEELERDPILSFPASDVKEVSVVTALSSEPQTYHYEAGAGLDEIMEELTESTILREDLFGDKAQEAALRDGRGGSGVQYAFTLKNGDIVELDIDIRASDLNDPENKTFTLIRSVNGTADYAFNRVYLFHGPVGRWWYEHMSYI